jgi:hypothetical protein
MPSRTTSAHQRTKSRAGGAHAGSAPLPQPEETSHATTIVAQAEEGVPGAP